MRAASIIAAATVFAAAAPAQAINLDEAIAAALAHAPVVDVADADADAAHARVRQARAAYLPSAGVMGSYGFGRLDPKNFFGMGAENVRPRSAQVAVEQPLFTGGRAGAGLAQAKAGRAAAEAGRTATRSDLVVAVTQSYGDVLTADRLTALYQRLVDETTEIHRQATLRYKAGESPSTDVSQAAARLAEAQAGLARAEGMKVSVGAHFVNLTGRQPVDLQPLPANPPLPATLEEAMDAAMQANPRLAQARAGLKAAEAAARGARAERLPTIGAFAEGALARDQFFPGYQADSATVGVRARWDLFTGGRVSGRIAETDSGVRAADARLRAARQQVEEAVIAAWQDVHTARLVETAASDQSAAAEQALNSVRHEVRVGMKPQLDLLDAEREAIGAAAAATTARTGRIVAAYRLLSVVGK